MCQMVQGPTLAEALKNATNSEGQKSVVGGLILKFYNAQWMLCKLRPQILKVLLAVDINIDITHFWAQMAQLKSMKHNVLMTCPSFPGSFSL